MTDHKSSLLRSWKTVLFLGALSLTATLTACGGNSSQPKVEEKAPVEEVKGSLSRSFSLVDEMGRKSGTLTIDALGGATLYDANDKVIGRFDRAQAVAAPAKEAPAQEAQEGKDTAK